MHSNTSLIKGTCRLAIGAAAVVGALQAHALADPARGSVASTLMLANQAAIGARGWFADMPGAWTPLAPAPFVASPRPTLEWPAGLGARATGPWSFAWPAPALMTTPGLGGDRVAGAGIAAFDAGVFGGAGRAAPVDISMKPVANSAAAPEARLQPAIYARPPAAPSSLLERAPSLPRVGQGGSPDLFGSVALAAGHTPEDAKWRRVADYVPAGAGPWSAVLAQARHQSSREQLGTVNAWVNHAIAYAPDVANYGVADYWGTARESLARGRGDCKDYAITKMELLRALGVPSDDLYLVLVKDLVRRQDHAVLAVRLEGRFVVLDSGFDGVMDADDVRDYRPILTYSGARTWVHGYRRTANVMVASAAGPAAPISQ